MEYFQNDAGSLIGSGDILIGVKARFLDEEQSGIAVSTYPQYEFHNSSISEDGQTPQLFLPLEAAKTFGRFHYAADVGYSFLASAPNEFAYDIVMGYDQSEPCELLLEVHGDNQIHIGFEEMILNLGLRYNLSSSLEFIASAGTTMYSIEPGRTSIAYLGVCWRL